MALRVGALLRAARRDHPERFKDWVENELPFGLDTARRLMSISEAYSRCTAEQLANLPRPWQALYALRVLPADELQAAIDAGVVTPDMTTEQAKAVARRWRTGKSEPMTSVARHHRADIAAGAVMQFSPSDLNPHVLRALRRWASLTG